MQEWRVLRRSPVLVCFTVLLNESFIWACWSSDRCCKWCRRIRTCCHKNPLSGHAGPVIVAASKMFFMSFYMCKQTCISGAGFGLGLDEPTRKNVISALMSVHVLGGSLVSHIHWPHSFHGAHVEFGVIVERYPLASRLTKAKKNLYPGMLVQ